MRNNYENQEKGKNVPSALKYLIRNFSMKSFSSNIMTLKQDLNLVGILSRQLSKPGFKKTKLLYRASENGYSSSSFHSLCDNQGKTITIIKSGFGNIFGGYTNIPWKSYGGYKSDQGKSFIFLLHSNDQSQQCPKIWNYRKKGSIFCGEVCHREDLNFGNDISIKNDCNKPKPRLLKNSFCEGYNYLNDGKEPKILCGGDLRGYSNTASFCVEEYEVFRIE